MQKLCVFVKIVSKDLS